MNRIFILTAMLIVAALAFSASRATADTEFAPGLMYVKYRSGVAKTAMSSGGAPEVLEKFGAQSERPAFTLPDPSAARKPTADYLDRRASLESISLVSFPHNADIPYLARKISGHPDIEYAEPVYIAHTTAIPDDYYYDRTGSSYNQYSLFALLRAESAWDIAKGDSTVVIAIVDSGTDWNHPDLLENLWTNEDEIPDNGVDDDGNGFKDDDHGWDFYGGENGFGVPVGDNDPTSTQEPHGTHVAGIAAGVTDNGVGIASLSWNVEYMPIKTSPDVGPDIYFGYQGIRYAADNGADVINCSWGSPQFSNTGLEVIEYARSVNKDIIIVAAAGNDDIDMLFYPAAYPNVIGVGSIDFSIEGNVITTQKSSFSNYGSFIDVSAPGNSITSTLLNDTYGFSSGTSMAAPFVSSLAGLLKSANPDWDADRIQAQIVGTARPVGGQSPLCYLCGSGYIDAEMALSYTPMYVDIVSFTFTDENGDGDKQFRPGETIEASVTLHNYGGDMQNVSADLSSLTGYLSPVTPSFSVGSLLHGEEKTIENIRFTVSNDVLADAREFVRIDFETPEKDVGFRTIDVTVNPSFTTFTTNTIALSVDGAGHVGYLDYPDNSKGIPFVLFSDTPADPDVYNVPLLFEGGLMVGHAANRVSNGIRGDDQLTPEQDFTVTMPFTIESPEIGDGQKATVVFNDDGAGDKKLGITVTMETYAYSDPGHDRYMILAYRFSNAGPDALDNVRAGLFLDFDIPDESSDDDIGTYDAENDVLIMQENDGQPRKMFMVGGTVLGGIATPWLIRNSYEPLPGPHVIGSEFGIYDGFLEAEKWTAISAGKIGQTEVGPNDISMALSPEGFSLAPGESQQVVFILAYGFGESDLLTQIANARIRAADISVGIDDDDELQPPLPFAVTGVSPNPFNPRTVVSFSLPEDDLVTLKMYDILGRTVRTLHPGRLAAGEHSVVLNAGGLASGIYIIGLSGDSGRQAYHKITLLK